MQLFYYSIEQNFWDSLNQYIFYKKLSDLLDDSEDEYFVWIGSILWLPLMHNSRIKKHIFSSGFAYGKIPKIDKSFNILCVRWPLTAKKLWIDKSLSIADGAILTPKLFPKNEPKIYECSFMPHHKSIDFCDFSALCSLIWIHYIDPTQNPLISIEEINKSKLLITEAMHGAIVADAYRIPWIGVDIYGVNKFKWKDWMLSLEMRVSLYKLPRLIENKHILNQKIYKKLKKYKVQFLLGPLSKIISFFYSFFYFKKKKNFLEILQKLSQQSGFLSEDQILEKKQAMLELCLESFINNYKKWVFKNC